jgi:hypothetical protein
MNEYGAFVKYYWEGKTRVFGVKPAKRHFIHHLGTRWRWVVSFTTRPIYLQENSSLYSLNKSPGESQNPDTLVILPVAELSSINERSFFEGPE